MFSTASVFGCVWGIKSSIEIKKGKVSGDISTGGRVRIPPPAPFNEPYPRARIPNNITNKYKIPASLAALHWVVSGLLDTISIPSLGSLF